MRLIFLIVFTFFTLATEAQANFIPHIHSHNDYEQKRPLLGALEAKAKSIEIDVFLTKDSLHVAHTQKEIKSKNTLRNIYLLPLQEYLSQNKEPYDFHLMIDIKSEPVSTLQAIQKCLSDFPHIFSKDGIQVVISGNRPRSENYSDYAPFIWFDGRDPRDVHRPGGERICIISQNLSKFTKWRGKGTIPDKDKQLITKFISDVHKQDKAVRFWNTSDNITVHDLLSSLGVDYLNTDNPKALRKHLDTIDL